jgi:hypothetical protein
MRRLVSSISSRVFVMTNLSDPDTRCYALVGRFLQAWSAMELSLRDAIGAALSIEVIKLQIICSNMRFRDKTKYFENVDRCIFFGGRV